MFPASANAYKPSVFAHRKFHDDAVEIVCVIIQMILWRRRMDRLATEKQGDFVNLSWKLFFSISKT